MASEWIVSADEARALREKWRRYDGPYEVSPDDTGDLVIHYEDTIVARIEDFDEHSEPLARLFASAPDDVKMLARTVEALHAAVSDLRTDNTRLDDVARGALDDLARVREELAAAHDLIAAQAALLTGVANALRGEPAPLASHSHHDLDLRAAQMKRELDETRAAVREYFAAIDATGPITPEYGARWAASREVLRKIVEGDR